MNKTHTSATTRLRLASLLAALAMTPLLSSAQTTFDWTGSTSGTWGTASNWDPATGAPPGTSATDIARFSTTSANTTVTLGSSTTIQQLEFASGASQYDIAGSRLVIASSSGPDYIVHNAGNIQTISAELELNSSGTFRDLSIGTGSTLVIEQKLIFSPTSGQIRVAGGGTIEILDGFTGLNIFNLSGGGSTLNFRGNGGVNRLRSENGARINLFTSHGGDFTIAGNNASIYLRFNGTATGIAGSNTASIAPSASGTVTLGADIEDGGTGTFTRNLRLFQAGTVANATVRFDTTAGSILNLSGVILDENAAGSGSKVEITGAGMVRFSGTAANTSVTPILISSGTLELAKDDNVNAIAGGTVTVQSSGTLRLAASNQIANSTGLILEGGSFSIGSFSDTVGTLSIGADGGLLDFAGETGTITFASLAAIDGVLTITGWGDGATILFTDGSGWNSTALALVDFQGFGAAGFNSETGELYAAIPEPATIGLLLGLSGLAVVGFRRRHASTTSTPTSR